MGAPPCRRLIILAIQMGVKPLWRSPKDWSMRALLAEWSWSGLRFLLGFAGLSIEKKGGLVWDMERGLGVSCNSWKQVGSKFQEGNPGPNSADLQANMCLSVLEFRDMDFIELGMHCSSRVTYPLKRKALECRRHIRTMGSVSICSKENLQLPGFQKRVSTILTGLKSTWNRLKLKQYVGLKWVCKVGCFTWLSVFGPVSILTLSFVGGTVDHLRHSRVGYDKLYELWTIISF